jgi:hypothetical protein
VELLVTSALSQAEKESFSVIGNTVGAITFEQLESMWWQCIVQQSSAVQNVIRHAEPGNQPGRTLGRSQSGVDTVLSVRTQQSLTDVLDNAAAKVRADAYARLQESIIAARVEQVAMVTVHTPINPALRPQKTHLIHAFRD